MKLLVIGQPDAVLGFSLVGVHGQPVTSATEASQALESALSDPETGIILVTEDIANLIAPRMDQLMLHATVPLVVVMPPPGGSAPGWPSLSEMVRRAVGMKI
jgi:V/A-type H+/Na+-transporting ATPase subunit F